MTHKFNINVNPRTFYFAKGGDDEEAGGSLETAKSTIQSAVDEINALIPPPTVADPSGILSSGSGAFSESNIQIPEGCQFNGQDIRNFPVTGNAFEPGKRASFRISSAGTIAASSVVFFVNNKPEIGIEAQACVCLGANSTGVHILGTSDDVFVTISQLQLAADGCIGILDETDNGAPEIYNINELTLEGNNTTGFKHNPTVSTSQAVLNIGLIGEVNSFTGTKALEIVNGIVHADVTTINAEDAVILTAGILTLTSGSVTGDITVADGAILSVNILEHSGEVINNGTIFGRIGNRIFRGIDSVLFDTNYLIQNPGQSSTTAETGGRVDIVQKTTTTDTITAKQFTGSPTNPLIEIDNTGIFSANDIVLVEDTKFNDGLYEVSTQLGFVIFARSLSTKVEGFTEGNVITAVETGKVTKVLVSVWQSSLTGAPEHGRGSETPIAYEVLAHAADVPIVATEEFANTNARFFGELGLPAGQQTWVDLVTGSATIDLVTENVFGTSKQVVRHNDDVADGSTTSQISLTAQNWIDINANGASFSGTARMDTINGSSGFFTGLQADAAENPLATGNRRYGVVFDNNGGNLRLIEADNTGNNVTMDGTGGNPLVAFDEYYDWECLVPAGLSAAQFFINGVLTTFVPTFFVNGGGLGTRVLVSSGSTGGTNRIVFHDNFGVTIYEEAPTKILSVATMAADIAQIFIPEGKRDYFVILPDGNPRKLGSKLDFITRNVGGKLTLRTEDLLSPESIFNGLRQVEKDIISISEINLINTVEAGNVYVGEFEDIIIYEHSGLIASGDNGGPKGMSILNATTFRIEPIKAVIVDRSLNTSFPSQTFIDLPQTDHVITGGGDQIVNTYINAQGVFEFRAAEPTSFAVTGEIFIGKAVMDAGVITVAVFTPNVAYTGSVDGQAELINGGGHKTSGSILSAGGANLTLSVTAGNHHQIGRGFLSDPNSPNLCETEARAVIAFTGTTGNLFLVHADSGGNFIIDSFISNSANPDIDPTTYNPSGTLVTVPVNDVTAKRVFQACGTNDIIVYSGTVAYANMAAAEAGFEDETPELLTTRDISYICTILVKETITDLAAGVIAGDVIFKNRSGDREL